MTFTRLLYSFLFIGAAAQADYQMIETQKGVFIFDTEKGTVFELSTLKYKGDKIIAFHPMLFAVGGSDPEIHLNADEVTKEYLSKE